MQNYELYCKRIQFLRDNIAPDDIYEFAEQAIGVGEYFLTQWSQLVDIPEKCKENLLTKAFVSSLLNIRDLCDKDYKEGLDIPSPWDFN